MKVVIAIAPEKYRDEELAEPVAALNSAGIAFDIASTRPGTSRACWGKTLAGISFDDVDPKNYKGLIIIGGSGSPAHILGRRHAHRACPLFPRAGKVVAAICLAPVVLAKSRYPQTEEGYGL